MSLNEALYKQLSTATLTTQLGSTAIYPMVAPQGKALPYVTYHQISEMRVHAMVSDPGIERCRYRLSFWSTSHKQVKLLADKGREVLQNFSGNLGGSVAIQRIFFDEEVDMMAIDNETQKITYRTDQDYILWYST